MQPNSRGTAPAIGRALPREATRRLVAGRGRYVDDHALKGELHAAFLRSPHAQASFRILDLDAARALDGVRHVLSSEELDEVCTPWQCRSLAFPGAVSPVQRPLAKDHVLFTGEPVVLVLATSRAIAEDALELIEIEWIAHEPVFDLQTALDENAPTVHPELSSNLSFSTGMRSGDPESVFETAAVVVGERLVFERKTGVTLEPRGVLANFDPAARSLNVVISHQMPHQIQLQLAELLSLSPADVRVVCPDVGGGFGLKMHVYPEEVAACAASKLVGRPVRFVADRIESLSSDIHAREHVVEGRMALDAAGKILGIEIDDLQGLGAYSVFPRSSIVEAMSMLRAVGGPYRFDAFSARLRSVLQNKAMTGQYRSVGHPIACAITESLVEAAARALGIDALELRRRNFVHPDEMPWVSPQGARMADLSHHACLEKLEALIDLPALRKTMGAMRSEGRLVGLGIASFVEFTATGAEAYGKAAVPVAAIDSAVLSLEPSGDLVVRCSASEIGQGIQQGLAQIAADAFGVEPAHVRVLVGDTAVSPHGGGAWSSRGAAITGEAVWEGGRRLRAQMLDVAAALLQTTSDRLDIREGKIVDAEGVEKIDIGELARTSIFRPYELPQGCDAQLTASAQFARHSDPFLPTNGIQASLVEVDADTGIVRVLRHWVVEDCGRIINPLLVDEQIRGGVVQGIGEALLEACRYDESGQFTSATLADYLLPMASEMPDIEIAHVETPYSGTVLGAKGAGEAGTCGAPAAVLNAVNDALAPLGAKVSKLPIVPWDVLSALADARAEVGS